MVSLCTRVSVFYCSHVARGTRPRKKNTLSVELLPRNVAGKKRLKLLAFCHVISIWGFFKCNVERLVLRRTDSLLLKYDLKNFLLCTFFELHVSNRPPPFYSSHLNTDKCTLSSLNAAIYLLLEPICLTINIFVLHFNATLGHGFTTLAC